MSIEFSFEELRADHRGWMTMDWAAIRREEQTRADRAAQASAAKWIEKKVTALAPVPQEELPKPQTVPLKGNMENNASMNDENTPPHSTQLDLALRTRTIPLKGSKEQKLTLSDENSPPSQAEVEKAKSAKKARKEERANRTRKIKVMEVKEIRGETQTSKSCTHYTMLRVVSLTLVQYKPTSTLQPAARYDARRLTKRRP
jgi:checkpoint serine/threonine-protein kinase